MHSQEGPGKGPKGRSKYLYNPRFLKLLETVPDATLVASREGYVVFANERAERLFGYQHNDLPGVPIEQLMPVRFRAVHPDLRLAYSQISSTKTMGRDREICAVRKDGSEFPVEISLSPLQTDGDYLVLAAIRDISERKQAEADLRHLNRALRTISECNQALIHAVDEPQLLQKICDVAVRVGDYRMAWVGYAQDDEAKSVRPVAHAGYEEGYLDKVNVSWADTERGRGPTGTAIRTGKTCFIGSFATDPSVAPWREQVVKYGYACSIALPLTAGGRTFGALTIYAQVPDAFYAEERALLEELAGDLAFGISSLRAAGARRLAEKALRESEERFRQMANHLEEVLWMSTATGSEILYINPAYEKVWGRSCESLYKHPMSWVDAIHPEDRERVLQDFQSEVSKGEFKAEYRIVRPEGSVRYIWDRSFPIRDEKGSIRRVVGIAEDITQRKQAEEDLRLRAEIIDQIHDSVISTDLDGRMMSWNKGAERLFGYSAEEALGKHVSLLYPETQHSFLLEKVIVPLKQKGSHEIEVRMRKKSGDEFFAHLSASLLRDNHGAAVGMIGYVMDITAQVRGRERLQESEEKYRELTESITDVFVELDSDLRYTYWNRAAEKLTGISAKDAIGKSFYDLFPKVRGKEVEKQYLETLRTHGRRSFESPFEIHGEEFVFDVTVYPSRHGLSVVAKDVTERKRAEEALRRQANLLEQTHDAIIVWEFPERIIYWNRGAEQLYGFPREEAMGRRSHELLRTEHPIATEEFEAIIERQGTWTGELTQFTREGLKIQVESRHVLMRGADGRRLVLETNRDITERILAQQAARAQTEVLLQAMQRLTTEPEPGRFLDEVLLAINGEFKAHSSALWLYDPESKLTRLHRTAKGAKTSASPDQFGHPNASRPVPATAGSHLASFYAKREPFIFEDPAHSPLLEPDVREWMSRQGIKSILAVPVLFGQKPIGSMTVRNARGLSFTSHEIQLAQSLAHQVALAVTLMRLAEQGQQAAVLEERNRMAREMHDTLSQDLAGIILRLEVAEDVLSVSPKAVGSHLARAKALAREAHAEARRSVWALRPGALESGGLPGALRQLCERSAEQGGTKVEFTLQGTPLPLFPDAENHLLRIGQEAVTNALRHAEAKKILVKLEYKSEKVSLEVEDDGKGFDIKTAGGKNGFGLISMRERSKRIGADFALNSSLGSGTQVVTKLRVNSVTPDDSRKKKKKTN